jgi:hypothetical protein
MPTYEIQAPDGNKYRIDGPAGATQEQVRAKVLEQHPDAGKPKPQPEGLGHKLYEATGLKGIAEAADIGASAVTGGIGSLVGGIVKAGGYANQALGLAKGDANQAGDELASALTWEPKTDKGKAVMADIAKGLQKFETWTDKQGELWHDAVRKGGDAAEAFARKHGAPPEVVDFIAKHKEELAAGTGAAVKTTYNAAPLILGGELTKLPGRVAKAGEALGTPKAAPPTGAPAAPAPELTLAPSPPRAAPGAPEAVPAQPAAPPLSTTSVPRGTPNVSLEGSSPPPGPTVTPRARAEAYVRDRLGLSWDALADATKRKLETVAAKAGNLEKLNPDAVKRQAHLEREGFGRKPITTTVGKLERDNAQLLREQGAAATPSGRSIVDTDVATNRDLRANIETLVERLRGIGQTRATATTREQVGAAVAGREKGAPGALTVKQAKAKAATRAAYEEARKTEPDATVAPDAMYEFVRGNPEVLNPQIQHLGWLNSWLKKAGIESEDVDAEGNPTTNRRPINARELDDLRKKAGKMAGGTGDSAHYAKEVLTAIDKTFDEGLPGSAAKWKAARAAHAAERGEFANQGAIARLVETKGGNFGTDPKTALEDVWKASVKNGKLEEIRTLKRSLLSGDAETRLAGKKALRELKAETGRDLIREITKGVSTNVKGETNITAEAINNWIKGMGGGTVDGGVEKLNVILGRRATNELMRIREDAQITKTEPTVRNVGSNTFQKILNWMDDTGLGHAVKKIPGAGPLVHLGESALKHVENVKAVRRAGETATSAAERAARKAAEKRESALQREQTRGRIPTPPPTYQGDRQ